MSKSHIQAFALAQIASITEKTVKDRLKYTVAGCKDGCLYSNDGTNYGIYNEDAPDTVFITQEDLDMSRVTGAKIAKIETLMKDFFNEYGTPVPTNDDTTADDNADNDSDSVEDNVETVETELAEEVVSDFEEAEDAIKKAIKKGKFKKAQKLIDEIGGHKKLQKKLDKASA